MDRTDIVALLGQLIENLINRDYQIIYDSDLSKLLTPVDIQRAIEEYPGNLSMPTNDNLNDYYEYGDDSSKQSKLIEFDLWFNQAKSDLTLSFSIDGEGRYSIENIHVL